MLEGGSNVDYALLAKEVYAAAKRENWNQNKINEMLKNPNKFEKYLNNVSFLKISRC